MHDYSILPSEAGIIVIKELISPKTGFQISQTDNINRSERANKNFQPKCTFNTNWLNTYSGVKDKISIFSTTKKSSRKFLPFSTSISKTCKISKTQVGWSSGHQKTYSISFPKFTPFDDSELKTNFFGEPRRLWLSLVATQWQLATSIDNFKLHGVMSLEQTTVQKVKLPKTRKVELCRLQEPIKIAIEKINNFGNLIIEILEQGPHLENWSKLLYGPTNPCGLHGQ